MNNHEAMYWDYDESIKKVRCNLCPHFCKILKKQYGICQTRMNEGNTLYAVNYGEVTSMAVDPIEKKPLYHIKPGQNILSIGTFGCNMKCSFCQNYQISQHRAKSKRFDLTDIERLLNNVEHNCGLSFTYNEPFMWYEYILDTAKHLKSKYKDLSIVLVSNGYVNSEPLKKILPYIDAINIDLKAFNQKYYQKICGAKLEPVLETIRIASLMTHVEVTTLMVTDEVDSIEEVELIARFISNVNPDIPLHLSRYFPNYLMEQSATNLSRIKEAYHVAKKYLHYVYIGNVANVDLNTYCPTCGELLIKRDHTRRTINYMIENKCIKCHEPIKVVL